MHLVNFELIIFVIGFHSGPELPVCKCVTPVCNVTDADESLWKSTHDCWLLWSEKIQLVSICKSVHDPEQASCTNCSTNCGCKDRVYETSCVWKLPSVAVEKCYRNYNNSATQRSNCPPKNEFHGCTGSSLRVRSAQILCSQIAWFQICSPLSQGLKFNLWAYIVQLLLSPKTESRACKDHSYEQCVRSWQSGD